MLKLIAISEPRLLSKSVLKDAMACPAKGWLHYHAHGDRGHSSVIAEQGNFIGLLFQQCRTGRVIPYLSGNYSGMVAQTQAALTTLTPGDYLYEASFSADGLFCMCDALRIAEPQTEPEAEAPKSKRRRRVRTPEPTSVHYDMIELKSAMKVHEVSKKAAAAMAAKSGLLSEEDLHQLSSSYITDMAWQRLIVTKSGITLANCFLVLLNPQTPDSKVMPDGRIVRDLAALFDYHDVTDAVATRATLLERQLESLARPIREPRLPIVRIGMKCETCDFEKQCWSMMQTQARHAFFASGSLDIEDTLPPADDHGRHPRHTYLVNNPLVGVNWLGPSKYYAIEEGYARLSAIPEEMISRHLKSAHTKLFKMQADAERPDGTYESNGVVDSQGRIINRDAIIQFFRRFQHRTDFIFLDFETTAPALPMYPGDKSYHNKPFLISIHKTKVRFDAVPDYAAWERTFEHVSLMVDPGQDSLVPITQFIYEHIPPGSNPAIFFYNKKFESGILEDFAERFRRMSPNAEIGAPEEYYRHLEWVRSMQIDLMAPFQHGYCYYPEMEQSHSLKHVAPAILGHNPYEGQGVKNGVEAFESYARITMAYQALCIDPEQRAVVLPTAPDIRVKLLHEAAAKGAIDYDQFRADVIKYCKTDTEVMVPILYHLYTLTLQMPSQPITGFDLFSQPSVPLSFEKWDSSQ